MPGTDDATAIRLDARRAIELYWQADRSPARSLAADALARAERASDPRALGAALHARRYVLRGPEGLAERIALAQRLVRLATSANDEELELSAYVALVPELLQAGDIAGVDGALGVLEDLASRQRRPLAAWYVLLFRSLRLAFAARFDEALASIARARDLG